MTDDEEKFESTARRLALAIEKSVISCVGGRGKVAVSFSGGLDSSTILVCARRHSSVVVCSAFSAGALDSSRAREGAKALGAELVETRLTKELVAREMEEMRLPFDPSPMDKELWCLYSIVGRSARAAGAETMLLGQLADELFGGYQKYERSSAETGAAEKMMEEDLKAYESLGRIRDTNACGRWLDTKMPYGDLEVIEIARECPLAFKLRAGTRKAVLRRAAVLLGVPETIAQAPKKAAQYSSGISKLVPRAGF